MSLLKEYDFPKNQDELSKHLKYTHRHSLSKVVRGYEYNNANVEGFCKWIHYEDYIQDVYFYSYGELLHKNDDNTYEFNVTIKKSSVLDYYSQRLDIASGNINFNYELDTYTPIGEWKYEHITDGYVVNNITVDKTIEKYYYNAVTGYEPLDDLIDYIRKDIYIPGLCG
jgi:hypothetical protein